MTRGLREMRRTMWWRVGLPLINDEQRKSDDERERVVDTDRYQVAGSTLRAYVMLTRVSCDGCGFICFWTDDPKRFLRSFCPEPDRCEARCRIHVDAERPGTVVRRARSTHEGLRVRPL